MQRDLGRLEGKMMGIEEAVRQQGEKLDALAEAVMALRTDLVAHRSAWRSGSKVAIAIASALASAAGGAIVLAAEWLRRSH